MRGYPTSREVGRSDGVSIEEAPLGDRGSRASRAPRRMFTLGRTMADLLERANRWLSRRRERAIEGCRDEVSALREDRHALTKRLELLAKVSALVDGDLETLLQKIAELSIPELADWSSVDVLGDGKARRIH